MSGHRLVRFWNEFLAYREAVAEPVSDGLDVLFEPSLAADLGVGDETRLVFDARSAGTFAGLGSDLMERALQMSDQTVPVAHALLDDVHLRGKNIDQDLKRDFTFVRCRPGAMETVSTLLPVSRLGFRLTMISDETRERLLVMDFLESTRRVLPREAGTEEAMELTALPADDPRLGLFMKPAALLDAVQASALSQAEAEIRDFQRTLRHRLNLDLNRLEDYYSGLLVALNGSRGLQRLKLGEREAKEQAINDEFTRQVVEVRDRSGLRAELRPYAVLRLLTPALRVKVAMHVGKARQNVDFFWTPFERKFEPFCCPRCSTFTHRPAGTRSGDLLCPDCA